VGVGAERPHREFDGVRLAEHDHAGADQPLGERRRHRRHAIDPRLRAAGRDAAFQIDQVLERDRDAVQRADAMTAPDRAVGGLGGQARLGLVDSDVAMESLARLDAREQRVDDVDG